MLQLLSVVMNCMCTSFLPCSDAILVISLHFTPYVWVCFVTLKRRKAFTIQKENLVQILLKAEMIFTS